MNIEKHLILVKDEDKTEQIAYCKYIDGKWSVTYHNNSTVYTYNYLNVVWHRDPRVITMRLPLCMNLINPYPGIVKILDFGDYIRILFKSGGGSFGLSSMPPTGG